MSLAFPLVRTKTYTWNQFLKIQYDEMVSLQVIPDKTVTNDRNLDNLVNAFHSIYKRIRQMFKREGWTLIYNPQSPCVFQILFISDKMSDGSLRKKIMFCITVPKPDVPTIKVAIQTTWPKATIRQFDFNYNARFNGKYLKAGKLELKDHYFKSLRVDKKASNHLSSVMSVVRSLAENDSLVIHLVFEPISDEWQKDAIKARNKYDKGMNLESRISLDTKSLLLYGVDGLFKAVEGFLSLTDSLVGGIDGSNNNPYPTKVNELSQETKGKAYEDGFNLIAYALVSSDNELRANKILGSVGSAYKDLSGDNSFVLKNVNYKVALKSIKEKRLPTSRIVPHIINFFPIYDIVSTQEALMLIKLPTASIQDEFVEIEQQSFREQKLPRVILEPSGHSLPFGHTTSIDPEIVYIHDKNLDERCSAFIIPGEKGSGKSVAGTNQCIYTFGCHLDYNEWKKKGRSIFLFDVADGKNLTDFLSSVPDDRKDRVIILDYGNTDYPIYTGFADVINTLNDDYLYDLAMMNVDLIETATEQKMGGQTQRWLVTALMASYSVDPDNTILEGIQTLLDDRFRNMVILKNLQDRTLVRELRTFNNFSRDVRLNIITPIENRLYKLTHNKKLWNCLAQRPVRDGNGNIVHDFAKWADGDKDGAYAVLVHVPPSLGAETQNIIMSANIGKLWYAVLNKRSRIPIDKRNKETLVVFDEPHQFMQGSEYWKRMLREARKYRLRMGMLFHGWSAIKSKDRELSEAILESGPNIHLLKGAEKNAIDLSSYIDPYTVEEYMKMPNFYSINRIKANQKTYVFMCKLIGEAKNYIKHYKQEEIGNDLWIKNSIKYGVEKEIVKNDIFNREDGFKVNVTPDKKIELEDDYNG